MDENEPLTDENIALVAFYYSLDPFDMLFINYLGFLRSLVKCRNHEAGITAISPTAPPKDFSLDDIANGISSGSIDPAALLSQQKRKVTAAPMNEQQRRMIEAQVRSKLLGPTPGTMIRTLE